MDLNPISWLRRLAAFHRQINALERVDDTVPCTCGRGIGEYHPTGGCAWADAIRRVLDGDR